MDLSAELLRGALVKVEMAGLPSFTVDLSAAGQGGEPSQLVSILRPRITVLRGDESLLVVTPAGPPEDGLPLGLMLLAVAGVVLFAFVRSR